MAYLPLYIYNTLAGVFFVKGFMNEKEAKRLKRIKESTEVNERYIEQPKRI